MMSSCCSEADDSETVCETSISDSCLHNRYYNDGLESDDEWEKCEKKRLEMLTEANEKADQMDKAIRWWAECTALWRKKWSVVRHERNLARSTIDKLMLNLNEVQNDTLKYFEAKVQAEQEIQRLKAQLEELRGLKNSDS